MKDSPRGRAILAFLAMLTLRAPAAYAQNEAPAIPAEIEIGPQTFVEFYGELQSESALGKGLYGVAKVINRNLALPQFDRGILKEEIIAALAGRTPVRQRDLKPKSVAATFRELSPDERSLRLKGTLAALKETLRIPGARLEKIEEAFQRAHGALVPVAQAKAEEIAEELDPRVTPPEDRAVEAPLYPSINLIDDRRPETHLMPSPNRENGPSRPPAKVELTPAQRTAAIRDLLDKLAVQAAEHFAFSSPAFYDFLVQNAPSSAVERFERHREFAGLDDAALQKALQETVQTLQKKLQEALRAQDDRELKNAAAIAGYALSGITHGLESERFIKPEMPLKLASLSELGLELGDEEIRRLGQAYLKAEDVRAKAAEDPERLLRTPQDVPLHDLIPALIDEQLILALGFENETLSHALTLTLPKLATPETARTILRNLASELAEPGRRWQVKTAILSKYMEMGGKTKLLSTEYTPIYRHNRRYLHALLDAYSLIAAQLKTSQDFLDASAWLDSIELPLAFQGHIQSIQNGLRRVAETAPAAAAEDSPAPPTRSQEIGLFTVTDDGRLIPAGRPMLIPVDDSPRPLSKIFALGAAALLLIGSFFWMGARLFVPAAPSPRPIVIPVVTTPSAATLSPSAAPSSSASPIRPAPSVPSPVREQTTRVIYQQTKPASGPSSPQLQKPPQRQEPTLPYEIEP